MSEVSQVLAARYPQARSNNLSNSDNDSVSDNVYLKNTNTKTLTLQEVHSAAYRIADKLNDPIDPTTQRPQHFAMFCGYAWKIPHHRLWLYLDIVLEARAKGKTRNAPGLFTWHCKQDSEYTK